MNTKFIAVLLVTIQFSVDLISGFPHIDLYPSDDSSSIPVKTSKVVTNTTSAIAVVNQNLHQQVKMLSDLINLSSTIAGKALPKPQNKNKHQDHNNLIIIETSLNTVKRLFTTSVIPTRHVGSGIQNSIFFFNTILDRGGGLSLLSLVAFLYLSIRRIKISRLFFLLARGSIDDAIMLNNMIFLNPHWLQPIEDFLLPYFLVPVNRQSNDVILSGSEGSRLFCCLRDSSAARGGGLSQNDKLGTFGSCGTVRKIGVLYSILPLSVSPIISSRMTGIPGGKYVD